MSEELTPMNHRELWLKAIATGTVPEWLEPMTHEELWLKAIAQGGGGLPPVTASDAGKVATVDNSGVWGAQEPIGKPFVVTLTPTSADYSGTMDKTVAEIDAAYKAGRKIMFSVDTGAGVYYCNLSDIIVSSNSENVYPSFNANFVLSGFFLKVLTGATSDGNTHDYNTEVYTLTPAT